MALECMDEYWTDAEVTSGVQALSDESWSLQSDKAQSCNSHGAVADVKNAHASGFFTVDLKANLDVQGVAFSILHKI